VKIIKGVVVGILVVQLSLLTYPTKAQEPPPIPKGPAELIQIAVEVVEVNNTKANEVGIKWPEIMEASEMAPMYGTSAGDGVRYPTLGSGDEVPLYSFHDMGKIRRLNELKATLKLLEDKGAAHIMANPKLVTESGSVATFFAGGEIPYQEVTSEGTGIEYKEYGIKLNIRPIVLKSKKIRAEIEAEVSRLDYSVALEGTPGLSTRKVTSRANLDDGDTIVIGGLVQTTKEKTINGIPGLCKIPGIGLLFGRTKWVNNKTTVVIFVTFSFAKKGAK